ncbi:LIM domain protein [Paecilomyces variotii No. 5]|uniref:LIM domain protein n=1 Tax=Byssochlamys spectabilis (strain No. 5 / NBRC 109023) TaxID=1356009 RepID=V5FAZ6_BYSSN|nr:LIM domain protein [Paecilomyces variotii No. 5]
MVSRSIARFAASRLRGSNPLFNNNPILLYWVSARARFAENLKISFTPNRPFDQPFLRPDPLTPASNSPRYSPFSAGNKSPFRKPERTVTSPLPRPPSPELTNLDYAFPPFSLSSKSKTLPEPKVASPVESEQEENPRHRWNGSMTSGDPLSRPSTSNSNRRPSASSVSRGLRTFWGDEAPPVPSGLPAGFTYESTWGSGNEHKRVESRGRLGARYDAFNSEITEEPLSYDNAYEGNSSSSLALHRTRTLPMTQDERYDSVSLKELPRRPSGATDASQYRQTTMSEKDVPPIPENREHQSFSSSYATSSTGSSPSETTSQSSLSSPPSVSSRSSRRKPSDLSKLDTVLKELQPFQENKQDSPYNVDATVVSEDSILAPPRIGESFYMPDSPTDPAMEQGGLSFISNASYKNDNDPTVPRPLMTRSATEPPARRPVAPRKRCRGCEQIITGKSVSSADGRLTGRYHKTCFVCYTCRAPFQTADFYVLDDRPYCAQHYHELNGSLCAACNTGIEGQYLETNETVGRGENTSNGTATSIASVMLDELQPRHLHPGAGDQRCRRLPSRSLMDLPQALRTEAHDFALNRETILGHRTVRVDSPNEGQLN